jgi:hypothetical protein
MSRGRARFTQADVARAIRAAQRTGAGEVIIEPDGSIRIVVTPSTAAKRSSETEDEILDRELAEFEAEHAERA